MTKKELSQLYWLNREIETLQERIEKLDCMATKQTQTISDMPGGGGLTDKVAQCVADMADLKSLLVLKQQECFYEFNRINRYIHSEVDDILIRQAMCYRFINGLKWEQVAANMGGNNTGDSVRMMVGRFLSEK